MFGFGKKGGPEAGGFEKAMTPEEVEALADEIEAIEGDLTEDDFDRELDLEEDMPRAA